MEPLASILVAVEMHGRYQETPPDMQKKARAGWSRHQKAEFPRTTRGVRQTAARRTRCRSAARVPAGWSSSVRTK